MRYGRGICSTEQLVRKKVCEAAGQVELAAGVKGAMSFTGAPEKWYLRLKLGPALTCTSPTDGLEIVSSCDDTRGFKLDETKKTQFEEAAARIERGTGEGKKEEPGVQDRLALQFTPI